MKKHPNGDGTLLPVAKQVKQKIRVGKQPVRRASDYRLQSQAEQEQTNRTINALFRATWKEVA